MDGRWQGVGPDHSVVRQCYQHDQGCTIGSWMEQEVVPFADWCEARVNEWCERGEALGYKWPFYVIGTVGTTQTYHEWLKERVGL